MIPYIICAGIYSYWVIRIGNNYTLNFFRYSNGIPMVIINFQPLVLIKNYQVSRVSAEGAVDYCDMTGSGRVGPRDTDRTGTYLSYRSLPHRSSYLAASFSTRTDEESVVPSTNCIILHIHNRMTENEVYTRIHSIKLGAVVGVPASSFCHTLTCHENDL